MAGRKLAKNLKAEIDKDRMAAYRGTESLPFEPGEHGRAAVKIVDDRGVESLKNRGARRMKVKWAAGAIEERERLLSRLGGLHERNRGVLRPLGA